MSRNYKFHNPEGLYFISFVVVGWLDVFIPPLPRESLRVGTIRYFASLLFFRFSRCAVSS